MERIDHVGVAVKDLKAATKFFEDILDLKPTKEVKTEQIKAAFIPIGDGEIELIEPTDANLFIAKFTAERGEGIHHISLQVKEIEKALEKLKEKGIKLVDENPRIGVHGAKIAFLDPESTRGILIELCEKV